VSVSTRLTFSKECFINFVVSFPLVDEGKSSFAMTAAVLQSTIELQNNHNTMVTVGIRSIVSSLILRQASFIQQRETGTVLQVVLLGNCEVTKMYLLKIRNLCN
jgi:hypothetical protein